MPIKSNTNHLHLESNSQRPLIFQPRLVDWQAAALRHRALAKKLRITAGENTAIFDEALKTADFLLTNTAPPRDELRARAPNLKWIQTTSAGVDFLMPLTWLPKDIALTNNRGAHGPKAEESCLMALLMLQARMPEVLKNQSDRVWRSIFTTPIIGATAVIIGFGDLGQGAGRAAKKLGIKVIAVTRSGKAHRLADRVPPSLV